MYLVIANVRRCFECICVYVFEVRVTDKRFGGLNRMFEFFL